MSVQWQRGHVLAAMQAVGLVLTIVVVEYFARFYVANWLPVLGAFRVNDMLSSALLYGLLVVITISPSQISRAGLRRTLREIAGRRKMPSAWTWVAIAIGCGWLVLLDRWLWGSVRLPEFNASANTTVWFPNFGLPLTVISVLLVNGIIVPVIEEWLWRGLIQPRLTSAFGFVPGLLTTAVLFSLKHVVIDASLGRLLTLIMLGSILGYVAARYGGWKSSAFVHAAGNTIGTCLTLILSGGMI